MESVSEISEDTALAIFESLGGPTASLVKKIAEGEQSISNQQRDLEKLRNKLQEVKSDTEDKEKSLAELTEMTKNVQVLLQQMINWESTLNQEEAAILKEIEKVSTTINTKGAVTDDTVR
eukprot:g791.t1